MFHCRTLICGILLVSVASIESKGEDASALYKDEKNRMLWDMTNYCIAKAREIYTSDPKESDSSASTNLKREKSLPYLEKAKQLILELEDNYRLDEPDNEYLVATIPKPVVSAPKPLDCTDIFYEGHTESGLYTIWPAGNELQAYCDMVTDGGGWTVIQRRGKFQLQENFYRGWDDYENGFGDLTQEFWLGNKNIYLISNQSQYEIRFDLTDVGGMQRYAVYQTFWLDDGNSNYTLHIEDYSGDAGDSMAYHNNHTFSTKDTENPMCAVQRMAGWWYDYCTESNLNGLFRPGIEGREGMTWYTWHVHTSLAGSEIKLRKKN